MSFVPMVTGLAAWMLFGAELTRRKIAALCLAVVGVVLVQVDGLGAFISLDLQTLLGTALVLVAVLSEATFTLAGKKISENVDPVFTTGVACWIAALLLSPAVFSYLLLGEQPQWNHFVGFALLAGAIGLFHY
jgi:drug/metabolite transporter (DMT)-like permease